MLRFLKKHTTLSKQRVPPENPVHRNTGINAGHHNDPEGEDRLKRTGADGTDSTMPPDINRGGGPLVANQGGSIENHQLPAPNTSTLTPRHAHDTVESGRSGGRCQRSDYTIARVVDRHYHLVEETSRADKATFVLGLAKGSAEVFGPLKAVLKSVSAVYAKHQVCLTPRSGSFPDSHIYRVSPPST